MSMCIKQKREIICSARIMLCFKKKGKKKVNIPDHLFFSPIPMSQNKQIFVISKRASNSGTLWIRLHKGNTTESIFGSRMFLHFVKSKFFAVISSWLRAVHGCGRARPPRLPCCCNLISVTLSISRPCCFFIQAHNIRKEECFTPTESFLCIINHHSPAGKRCCLKYTWGTSWIQMKPTS